MKWIGRDVRALRAFRVEHHHDGKAQVLGLITEVAAHHATLVPYVSALVRTGETGEVRLVDVETGAVVARRRIAPHGPRPFRARRDER